MAATKTKAKAKTKKASGAKAAKPKRAAPKRQKPRSAKPRATKSSAAKPGSSSKPSASSNGHAGKSVASKAMLPLLAGGAALAAGTVGGVLIGASNSGKKVLGVSLPHPKRMQMKVKSSDLARAAKEVGRFGENVGELTTELKRAREGLAGNGKHDSPIEVLLRGLSTRR